MTTVHLERSLPERPDRVFAAFADAGQLRNWFGPAGFTVSDLRFDAVQGRDYRIVMKPPEGDVFHIRGRFLEVDAPRKLAYTFVYEEPDRDDQETVVTVAFEPADPGTRVILDHGEFKTAERRQLHHDGWTETLDRLGRFLL